MAYDPRSAAVIGLCIGAVLLAAVLFPAAGIDGAPASSGGPDDTTVEVPASDGSGTDGPSDGSPGDGADDGSSADGQDDGSGTDEQDDGSSDESGEDTGSEGDDLPAGDDGSQTDGSSSSDSDAGSSSDDPTVIERLFGSMAVGLMIALFLLVSGYAVVTGKLDGRTGDSGGGMDPLPDGPVPRLRARIARIPQVSMMATIGFARRATVAATVAETAFAAIGRTAVRSGLLAGAGTRTVLRSLTTLSIGFPSIPRLRLPAIGWPGGCGGGAGGSEIGTESTVPGATTTAGDEGYTEPETVEEAWRRLVASLAVRRPAVRTPRECAAIALDAGLPREAVERLTATFEAVRYGGAARTPARLERVRDAYARIRERGGDGR